MKNIILIGASRAGKSSFTKLLKQELDNITIIKTDLLRLAFREAIIKDNTLNTNLVKQNPDYINYILSYYNFSNKYDTEYIKVIDTVDFEPKDSNLFENSIMICLGYPNITPKEVVSNWRKYDTDLDWTKRKTNEELIEIAENEIKKSKQLKDECQKHNVKFVDTSFNRNEILKQLLKETINQIED